MTNTAILTPPGAPGEVQGAALIAIRGPRESSRSQNDRQNGHLTSLGEPVGSQKHPREGPKTTAKRENARGAKSAGACCVGGTVLDPGGTPPEGENRVFVICYLQNIRFRPFRFSAYGGPERSLLHSLGIPWRPSRAQVVGGDLDYGKKASLQSETPLTLAAAGVGGFLGARWVARGPESTPPLIRQSTI